MLAMRVRELFLQCPYLPNGVKWSSSERLFRNWKEVTVHWKKVEDLALEGMCSHAIMDITLRSYTSNNLFIIFSTYCHPLKIIVSSFLTIEIMASFHVC